MRPFHVIVMPERIEPRLQFGGVRRRINRRRRLQFAVHPLVPPVILRRAGWNETNVDAQAQQPARQATRAR
jgi:hypothetical protein